MSSERIDEQVHIMVDIETYDIKPSAVILSIGAVNILTMQEFYRELDPTTQYERTISQSTKDWWSKQPMPIPVGDAHLGNALKEFADWVNSFNRIPIIWCKGTDFDVAILTHAYNSLYMPVPWKYNNIRDCRTLFKVAQEKTKPAAHNALEDAKQQSDELISCLVRFGVTLA